MEFKKYWHFSPFIVELKTSAYKEQNRPMVKKHVLIIIIF